MQTWFFPFDIPVAEFFRLSEWFLVIPQRKNNVLSGKLSPYNSFSFPRTSSLPSWDASSKILGHMEFNTHDSDFLFLSPTGAGRTDCNTQHFKKINVGSVLRWSHSLCYTCYCQDLQIFVWSGSTGFKGWVALSQPPFSLPLCCSSTPAVSQSS